MIIGAGAGGAGIGGGGMAAVGCLSCGGSEGSRVANSAPATTAIASSTDAAKIRPSVRLRRGIARRVEGLLIIGRGAAPGIGCRQRGGRAARAVANPGKAAARRARIGTRTGMPAIMQRKRTRGQSRRYR